MSEDEIFITVVAIALGPVLWIVWLFRLWRLPVRPTGRAGVRAVTATIVACGLLMYTVLRTAASFDVVAAPEYVFMYVVLGLAWLRIFAECFAYLGLSARDDMAERGNTAAIPALAGALIGVTFCYAGGNIGDGPGWWVVVFAAALATGTWLVEWLVLTFVTPVADAVTIDRDPAAGLRLGAFLASCGLILGRAAAGNWVSADSTVNDFVVTMPPALLLLALASFVERRARPTAQQPHAPLVGWGLLPATAYVAIAVGAVVRLGLP